MPGAPKQLDENSIERLIAEAQSAQRDDLPPPVQEVDDEDEIMEVGSYNGTPKHGVPSWAKVPADFAFPDGWIIWFVRFPARYTNRPKGPERQCILWNLSENDEKRAARRAGGSGVRIIDEMAKGMIRVVDGLKVSGEEGGNLSAFWTEIGGKCRHQIKSLYLKTHVMNEVENADFFEQCVAPRTVG